MESDKTKLNNSNKLSKTLNLPAEQIGADKCENETFWKEEEFFLEDAIKPRMFQIWSYRQYCWYNFMEKLKVEEKPATTVKRCVCGSDKSRSCATNIFLRGSSSNQAEYNEMCFSSGM